MKPRRVVVANSVGVDRDGCFIMHSPSRWSQGVKNARDLFTYYPWELAYCSSLLKRDTDHHVKFLDGCLEKLDQAAYRERLGAERPDDLVMEPSTRTLREDLELALWCKSEFGTRLIFAGQHATAFPEDLKARGVDVICQGEYEMTVRDVLRGADAGVAGVFPNARRGLLDVNDLPLPEDTDVRRIDYATPGEPNCEYREIQMYATRGCPLLCNFCIASNLYYARSNYRRRRVESVVDEIRLMKEKYPEMEGVFFDEEIHNADRKHVLELTRAIRAAGLDSLKYNAMCGHWTLDRETLEAMKAAGYYKIRVGVETADPATAEAMGLGPKHKLDRLEENLRIARAIGLKVYATFTIGGRGSSLAGDRATGALIERLVGEDLVTDLQISINTPLPGGPFFNWAREKGYLIEQDWSRFDGGNFAIVSYPGYTNRQIEENFRHALDSYDRGLKRCRREPFGAGMAASLGDLPEAAAWRRVLVLRSNRMWHAELVIETLRRELRLDALDVVAQPAVGPAVRALAGVDGVFVYDKGFFTRENFRAVFGDRFDGRYDAVIVLIANRRRAGYDEVIAIARDLKIPAKIGVLPEGDVAKL